VSAKPKVLVVGGLNLAESLWSIYRGFERLGCEMTYLRADVVVNERKVANPTLQDDLLAALDKGQNLLFWWQPQNNATTEILDMVRARFPRPALAGQSIDDPFAIDFWHPDEIWKRFDLAVTCCVGSLPWYEKLGVKAIAGYPHCDATLHGAAVPTPAAACDISFVATNVYPKAQYPHVLANRIDMVTTLADLGSLHLYGYWDRRYSWGGSSDVLKPYYQGFIQYTDHPGVYAASRINLSSHVRPDGYRYLNERTVLAMASGGFVLCDRVNGMSDWLRDGHELALWSDLKELRDKAQYYLTHDDERRRIAQAGRARALSEFDNAKLAQEILSGVGLE
jgi:hypothetical protein